jgi:alkylation response protein AidB-like acyl-CoA dehydrogenase
MAKWYATEAQVTVDDRCLQLHGGYGYMREYPSPGPTSTPASRRSTAEPPRS